MKERRLFTAATIYYTVYPNISLTLRQCSLLYVATLYADKQVINQRSYRNSVYLQFENHCLFISSAFLLPSHPFISPFSHLRSLACMHTKTLKCARELACLRIKSFFFSVKLSDTSIKLDYKCCLSWITQPTLVVMHHRPHFESRLLWHMALTCYTMTSSFIM